MIFTKYCGTNFVINVLKYEALPYTIKAVLWNSETIVMNH